MYQICIFEKKQKQKQKQIFCTADRKGVNGTFCPSLIRIRKTIDIYFSIYGRLNIYINIYIFFGTLLRFYWFFSVCLFFVVVIVIVVVAILWQTFQAEYWIGYDWFGLDWIGLDMNLISPWLGRRPSQGRVQTGSMYILQTGFMTILIN